MHDGPRNLATPLAEGLETVRSHDNSDCRASRGFLRHFVRDKLAGQSDEIVRATASLAACAIYVASVDCQVLARASG